MRTKNEMADAIQFSVDKSEQNPNCKIVHAKRNKLFQKNSINNKNTSKQGK